MLYGIILYDCYCAHPTPRQAENALAAAEAALTHARQLRGEQVYYCTTLCYCSTTILLYCITTEAALTHARQLRGKQVYYCATLCYCTTIALLYYLTI